MLRKLIAAVAISVMIGSFASLVVAEDDESQDRRPPKDRPAARDNAPGQPAPERGDAGPGRDDEWGPPGAPEERRGIPPGPPGAEGRQRPGGAGGERMPPPGMMGEGPMGGRGERGAFMGGRDQPMGPPGTRNPLLGPGPFGFRDRGSLEKSDPEMFKLFKEEMDLDRKTRELAHNYRQASTSQRDEIKKEIEKLVDQQFEVRQQHRQLGLKRFEEELQRLRNAIEQRNKARKQIVEKRVAELVGQEEEIGF
jgi:hypothetical protein